MNKLKNMKIIIVSLFLISIIGFSSNANAIQTIIKTDNDWSCPVGYYASSHNATTGITTCLILPSGGGGNSMILTTPQLYNYIISQNSTGVYATNGQTGKIDFSGNDPADVASRAALKFYPNYGNIVFQCGTWNFKSTLTTYSSISIIGCGEGQTIFKRNFNGTYLHTIVMNPNYNGNNGYAVLKDFTIDGNYGHVDNLQDEIAVVGHGYAENIEIKNYNAIGIQIAGDFLGYNLRIIGVNSSSSGSTMGIWQAPNTNTILNNPDIENNRIPAILSSGSLTINGGIIKHNHIQTSPTGGGQIAAGAYLNLSQVKIITGGGSLTSGVELNNGTYIISDNYITGNHNCGVVSNGQSSTIILNGNYLHGNNRPICQAGQSVWYNLASNIQ